MPGGGGGQGVEYFSDVAGERVALPIEQQGQLAMQHFVMPAFVDHLGCLKQFGVLAVHIFDQLAAHQHRTTLAVHQGRKAPPADIAVELDPLVGVVIRNGRLDVDDFALERTGFRFVHHDTKVVDFFDEDEVRRVYHPEM
jgi:hypothetical protein